MIGRLIDEAVPVQIDFLRVDEIKALIGIAVFNRNIFTEFSDDRVSAASGAVRFDNAQAERIISENVCRIRILDGISVIVIIDLHYIVEDSNSSVMIKSCRL